MRPILLKSILFILFLCSYNNFSLKAQVKQKPPQANSKNNKSKQISAKKKHKSVDSVTNDVEGKKDVVTEICFNQPIVDSISDNKPLEFVEQPPEFPGGQEKMHQFIQENLKYPSDAIEKKIEGRVWLSMTIKKDGNIADIKVLRSLSASCDEEAIRVVKLMPKWTPGQQIGRVVPVYIKLPVKFTLKQ